MNIRGCMLGLLVVTSSFFVTSASKKGTSAAQTESSDSEIDVEKKELSQLILTQLGDGHTKHSTNGRMNSGLLKSLTKRYQDTDTQTRLYRRWRFTAGVNIGINLFGGLFGVFVNIFAGTGKRDVSESTVTCQELSKSAGVFFRLYGSKLAKNMSPSRTEWTAVKEGISNSIFGFDIFVNESAREAFTCRMTDAKKLSEIKVILDELSFNFNVFRFGYDYVTMSLPFTRSFITDDASDSLVEALEASRLTQLDPEGTRRLAELLFGLLYDLLIGEYYPAVPYVGDNNAVCSNVTNALENFIREEMKILKHISPAVAKMVPVMIEAFIGDDIATVQKRQALVCDIIDARESGVQGVYDVLETHGVWNNVYAAGYSFVVDYITDVAQTDPFLVDLRTSGLLDLENDL